MRPPGDEEDLRRLAEDTKLNWESSPYYGDAEEVMNAQWRDLIHPAIRNCDFTHVVELAPGHGRNSEHLLELAAELHLIDVNEACIEQCRARFADHPKADRIHYHVNDGYTLSMVGDARATLVYCWDAMVHFDPKLIRSYLGEIKRILVAGGHAALHYSNYGAISEHAPKSWMENPHWRSSMTRDLFHRYCAEVGLEVVDERLLDWDGIQELDCATLITKP